MEIEFAGRRYTTTMGSDLAADGMFLQLELNGEALLDVFYSDRTHTMEMTAYKTDAPLPLELVEWFIAEARRRLPPAPEPASPA